jgi:Leucine-rich repeat (LRR) protein
VLNSDQCICGRFLKYFKFLSQGRIDESINIIKSFKRDKSLIFNKQNEFALFVKHKLEDLGYKVSEMVGLNNIYIDLAIRHPLYPEKYILGIECDNGILHSNLNVMDYINIRSKLLLKVGWYIEKIYCLDWLNNSENEINRIDGIIKKIILKELIETSEKLDLEHIQEENYTITRINDLQLYL